MSNSCWHPERVSDRLLPGSQKLVTRLDQPPHVTTEDQSLQEIAYRAGATTNIEVVQAQQTARNAEIAQALSEDGLRQARLDLLVALGQFPQ